MTPDQFQGWNEELLDIIYLPRVGMTLASPSQVSIDLRVEASDPNEFEYWLN